MGTNWKIQVWSKRVSSKRLQIVQIVSCFNFFLRNPNVVFMTESGCVYFHIPLQFKHSFKSIDLNWQKNNLLSKSELYFLYTTSIWFLLNPNPIMNLIVRYVVHESSTQGWILPVGALSPDQFQKIQERITFKHGLWILIQILSKQCTIFRIKSKAI